MIIDKDNITFNFTCPFCSKEYTINKSDTYNFPDEDFVCKHLMLWDSEDIGAEYPVEICNLEWLTRMADLPFRVWDILQEVINNDDLPDGCEVRIRAFYGFGYAIFVFCNDTKMLADVVREKTDEYIRRYSEECGLSGDDMERFEELLKT